MKIFIKQGAFILFLILIVSIILNQLVYPIFNITPWSWGSNLLHQKAVHLEKSDSNYNTLFIGSSRVYSHINPAIIDSITDSGIQTKAYNCGVNSLFIPETFYVYNNLINTNNSQYKHVIIELSKIRSVDFENLHTVRTFYWYNFENFIFSCRAILGSNFSIPERGYLLFIHGISYIDKLINLGYVTEAMRFNSTDLNSLTKIPTNGFVPLSLEEEELSGDADTDERNSVKRNRAFLRDTSIVTNRKRISEMKFQEYEDNPDKLNKYNRYYANYINSMILAAKKQGVHVYFLLSPRIDSKQYDELIPLFSHIDANHRIEVSDARKYPELYVAENSFDETHLNDQGANIYSAILAHKLNELGKK